MNNCCNEHHETPEELQQRYGKDAIIVPLGHINIVHLDHPSEETIRKRTEEVFQEELSGEAFCCDCPLCQEFQQHPYEIVYWADDF